MRCPTSILHPGAAFLSNPCHPFVARLPTDRRATTQRLHRVHAAPRLGKALFTLVQWRRLRPWHSNLRLLATGVSVSPMYPVSSVTYVPGLYPVQDRSDSSPRAVNRLGGRRVRHTRMGGVAHHAALAGAARLPSASGVRGAVSPHPRDSGGVLVSQFTESPENPGRFSLGSSRAIGNR